MKRICLLGLVGCLYLVANSPRHVRGSGFDSFGGIQGRDLITMNVIPNNRRWVNNTFSWEYNNVNAPAALVGLNNLQLHAAMDNWSGIADISVPVAPGAAGTQRVRISWANLGANTLASTGPVFAGPNLSHATITFNNNANISWSTAGFMNTLQHEFGHVLGLVDSYDDNSNTVTDFYDQMIGGDNLAGVQKGNRDNVMNGVGPSDGSIIAPFDNDDIHAAGWLYGTVNMNTIATAAWNTALGTDFGPDGLPGGGDDYANYYQVADHHGADNAPPRNWFYKGTIGAPSPGQTVIEIPALQVTAYSYAIGGGNAGWTANYNGSRLQLLGPANFTGNYDITLVSNLGVEKLVAPTINGVLFDDLPTWNGFQPEPMIWAPVPEPSTLLLAMCGLGALAVGQHVRHRKRASMPRRLPS